MSHNVIRHRITHLSVVALQLSRMMAEQNTFPHLKHVLVGGGPIPRNNSFKSHNPIPFQSTRPTWNDRASQLCTTGTNATASELKPPDTHWMVGRSVVTLLVRSVPKVLPFFWDTTVRMVSSQCAIQMAGFTLGTWVKSTAQAHSLCLVEKIPSLSQVERIFIPKKSVLTDFSDHSTGSCGSDSKPHIRTAPCGIRAW